jgi:hypothetical protein
MLEDLVKESMAIFPTPLFNHLMFLKMTLKPKTIKSLLIKLFTSNAEVVPELPLLFLYLKNTDFKKLLILMVELLLWKKPSLNLPMLNALKVESEKYKI